MTMHTTQTIAPRHLARGLGAGLLFSQLALNGFAQAQPEKTTDSTSPASPEVVMEEYQVSGSFLGSLQAAADMKQKAPTITETIAAEDIGKLPDISIADSLTRLTGVTTQRTNGRSQAVYIRGLTGDFSTAMLNGREQVSTGLNRAVEFDQYPAELLNSVVVYKTAAANLTGQGLAGTLDLRTVRPLDQSHRTFALSAYYQTTEYGALTPGASKDGQRVNLSYVDQLAGGKVGVALGFAHTSTPWAGKQFQAWGYPTDSAGNFALGGTKSYVRTSQLDRDGVMGVFQYKPNANFESTVDIYASHFEERQLLRGMEIPLAFWSSAQLQSGYTTSGGLITQATLKNVQPVVRNDIVTRNDDLFAAGWNIKIGGESAWPIIFDAGYSQIRRKDRNLETYSGLGFAQGATNPDTVTVKLTPGEAPTFTTSLDYSNASLLKLTDPQGWGTWILPQTGMSGYLKYFQAKDELAQLKLFTKHELKKGILSDFEIGASYTDRYKRDGESPTGYIYPSAGGPVALPTVIGTTDMSFLGLGKIAAYDPLKAYNDGVYGFLPNPNADVIANRWSVTEKITRGFAQLNFDGKVGDVGLTGNVGVQIIHVDQSSKGASATGSGGSLAVVPVKDGDKYTDVAPSLNLNFQPAERSFLRLSLARQIARPRMYDMKAGRTFNYNSTYASSNDLSRSPWSGDGGNPKLRPWKADSIDLSFEQYFKDNKGYFALTLFHKKLKSFIYEQTELVDFSGYPYTSGNAPVLTQGSVTTPMNGDGGTMRGIEATLSLPAEMLSSSLRGFGAVIGGAITDSSVKPWGPTGGTAPIAGLAKKVGNLTLYYERHGFSARVSQRFRSETREYITNFGPPNFKGDVRSGNGFSTVQPETVIDAQISYAFQSGRMKGLTVFVQGYNLNNEPLVTFDSNDPRRVMNYQTYGASYSVGASYKF